MKQLDEMERMARAMLDLRTGSYEHAPDIARALLAVMPVVRAAITHESVLLDGESTVIDANRSESALLAALDRMRHSLGGE